MISPDNSVARSKEAMRAEVLQTDKVLPGDYIIGSPGYPRSHFLIPVEGGWFDSPDHKFLKLVLPSGNVCYVPQEDLRSGKNPRLFSLNDHQLVEGASYGPHGVFLKTLPMTINRIIRPWRIGINAVMSLYEPQSMELREVSKLGLGKPLDSPGIDNYIEGTHHALASHTGCDSYIVYWMFDSNSADFKAVPIKFQEWFYFQQTHYIDGSKRKKDIFMSPDFLWIYNTYFTIVANNRLLQFYPNLLRVDYELSLHQKAPMDFFPRVLLSMRNIIDSSAQSMTRITNPRQDLYTVLLDSPEAGSTTVVRETDNHRVLAYLISLILDRHAYFHVGHQIIAVKPREEELPVSDQKA